MYLGQDVTVCRVTLCLRHTVFMKSRQGRIGTFESDVGCMQGVHRASQGGFKRDLRKIINYQKISKKNLEGWGGYRLTRNQIGSA